MVPADSDKISRVSPYSGYLLSSLYFVYRTLTFYGLVSQLVQLYYEFLTRYVSPTTPTRKLVWALSLSLATTEEIDFSFSSSGY